MIKRIMRVSVITALVIFLIFILLHIVAALILLFGIRFDNLDFNQIEISGLSVSLNPKLVVTIDEITVKEPAADKEESSDIKKMLSKIRMGFLSLYMVDQIEISKINSDIGTIKVEYKEGTFNISNQYGHANINLGWIEGIGISYFIKDAQISDYNISVCGSGYFDPISETFYSELTYDSKFLSGNFNASGKDGKIKIQFSRQIFNIYDINGTFVGNAQIDIKDRSGNISGFGRALGIEGVISASLSGNILNISIREASTQSLSMLSNTLPVSNNIKDWIHGKIKANIFKINEVKIDIDIARKLPLLDTLYVNATAFDADIKFNEKLPSAQTDLLDIAIEKSFLKITAKEAEYENQKADVNVEIANLYNSDATLTLSIDTPALFDQSIRRLVAVYGADLDITEHSGENITDINLIVPLSDSDRSELNISAAAKNGAANLFGVDLRFRDINLSIEDSLVILNQVNLDVSEIKNVQIDGKIDPSLKKFNLTTTISNATILKRLAFTTRRIQTDIYGRWNDREVNVSVPDFNAEFSGSNGTFSANITDITPLKRYVPLMQVLDLSGGNMHFEKKGENARADFNISMNTPILFNKGAPITNMTGELKIYPDGFSLAAMDNKLTFSQYENFSKGSIKDLELNIEAVINYIQRRKRLLEEAEFTDSGDRQIYVTADSCALLYKNHRLLTDTFSFYHVGDRSEINLKYRNAELSIGKNQSNIAIRGNRIGTRWIRELSGINMSSGVWDLSAYGSTDSADLYAVIYIKDAVIEDAMIISNVIALINTLPSLVQFKKPGFSSRGFRVNNGVVELYYASGVLYINAMRLMGDNSDILAQGSIDLKNNEVNIYASIQSVKNAASLIGKIPVIGYLLLGDNNRIENVLHITGKIESPDVKSEVVEEVIFYPINVLKRTLTLPLTIFN
jgi:hypothetical protein